MLNCECACHIKKNRSFTEKLVEYLADFSMSIFRAGAWAAVVIFLCAGSISSMMLLVKLYPELAEMILPFIELSGLIMKLALVGLVSGIFFSIVYFLSFAKNKNKELEN